MTLIIDCDPGVDDALAILLAVGGNLQIAGITTVDGNASLAHSTSNALTVLQVASREDIPVYPGAAHPLGGASPLTASSHGNDGLGGLGARPLLEAETASSAKEFLVQTASNKTSPLTIAALAPLTNIAAAVLEDPGFAAKVDRLVIMGGSIGAGNVTPAAEFNFWHDPQAADIVMRAGFPNVEVVGLDVTSQVFLDAETREWIRHQGGAKAEFVYSITRDYFDAYWASHGVVGAEMCDPLVVAHLLDDRILSFTEAEVNIEVEGASAGRSNVWLRNRHQNRTPNASFATNVNAATFFEVFLENVFDATPHRAQASVAAG